MSLSANNIFCNTEYIFRIDNTDSYVLLLCLTDSVLKKRFFLTVLCILEFFFFEFCFLSVVFQNSLKIHIYITLKRILLMTVVNSWSNYLI